MCYFPAIGLSKDTVNFVQQSQVPEEAVGTTAPAWGGGRELIRPLGGFAAPHTVRDGPTPHPVNLSHLCSRRPAAEMSTASLFVLIDVQTLKNGK